MSKREPEFDPDNPEWTTADFAQAKPASALPPDILAAFPNTRARGPGSKPRKVPISIRLSPDVIEHYKAGGPGWQTRIENTLRRAAGMTPADDTAPQI